VPAVQYRVAPELRDPSDELEPRIEQILADDLTQRERAGGRRRDRG
jgi:hypothetical protein